MSPRFKKNILYLWDETDRAKALVGFMGYYYDKLFEFMDKLEPYFINDKELFTKKSTGTPMRTDKNIWFFYHKDRERIEKHWLTKPITSFFVLIYNLIFKLKELKEWDRENDEIIHLIAISIETSHDYPSVIVETKEHRSYELYKIIKKVADEMSIPLYENREIIDMEDIIASNSTFDVEEENKI